MDADRESRAGGERRAGQLLQLPGRALGGYRRVYYRRGLEKFPPYGSVTVDPRTGDVLGVRVRLRPEETGTQPTERQLRARADSFVHSRNFAGAPSPTFESARPNNKQLAASSA